MRPHASPNLYFCRIVFHGVSDQPGKIVRIIVEIFLPQAFAEPEADEPAALFAARITAHTSG